MRHLFKAKKHLTNFDLENKLTYVIYTHLAHSYRVYQGSTLNLGKIIKLLILGRAIFDPFKNEQHIIDQQLRLKPRTKLTCYVLLFQTNIPG